MRACVPFTLCLCLWHGAHSTRAAKLVRTIFLRSSWGCHLEFKKRSGDGTQCKLSPLPIHLGNTERNFPQPDRRSRQESNPHPKLGSARLFHHANPTRLKPSHLKTPTLLAWKRGFHGILTKKKRRALSARVCGLRAERQRGS